MQISMKNPKFNNEKYFECSRLQVYTKSSVEGLMDIETESVHVPCPLLVNLSPLKINASETNGSVSCFVDAYAYILTMKNHADANEFIQEISGNLHKSMISQQDIPNQAAKDYFFDDLTLRIPNIARFHVFEDGTEVCLYKTDPYEDQTYIAVVKSDWSGTRFISKKSQENKA